MQTIYSRKIVPIKSEEPLLSLALPCGNKLPCKTKPCSLEIDKKRRAVQSMSVYTHTHFDGLCTAAFYNNNKVTASLYVL